MIGPGPGLILAMMLAAPEPQPANLASSAVVFNWSTESMAPILLICYSDTCDGDARVKVLKNGQVVFGAGYNPDETGRAFWKSIGEMRDRYEQERWFR